MKRLIMLLALTTAGTVHAYTDQRCAMQCRQDGHTYQWCEQRCEYDPMPGLQPFGATQPDPRCVQQCTAAGFNYMLCQQRCK